MEVDSEAFLLGVDNAYNRLDFQNIKLGAQEKQVLSANVGAVEGVAVTDNADIS